MNYIYSLMEFILPFEFMKYDFMKNAFIAVLIISPLFAMLGTMVVNNKMAFFSDALGHSALTGIAIGSLLGINQPIFSMLAFSIIFALGLSWIKSKNSSTTDTIISVFSSTAIAIGLVILSRNGQFAKYSAYLVGDILSVSASDILLLAIVFVIINMIWYIIYNDLLLISINPSLARSKNIKVKLIENIFLVLLAIVVTISIRWVGILVINSLLIIPCAAAKNISNTTRKYQLNSILIAVFSGISGLIISYYLNSAAGSTIVLISAVIYFVTVIINLVRGS